MQDALVLLPTAGTAASLFLLCSFAALLGTTAVAILRHAWRPPHDHEQARRTLINNRGRMGDTLITDVRGDLLIYEYSVRGVMYNASQDVSALAGLLPEDRSLMIGPASLKYHPQNPANSIVLCEAWSGLRVAPRTQLPLQPADPVPAANWPYA